jgi:hypothetical protein
MLQGDGILIQTADTDIRAAGGRETANRVVSIALMSLSSEATASATLSLVHNVNGTMRSGCPVVSRTLSNRRSCMERMMQHQAQELTALH